MPNGFPNIRHDPTASPRYIVKTSSAASTTSTQSPRYQDDPSKKETKPEKLSKWQYPIEKEDLKEASSKSVKADERSLSSQSSKRGLLGGFGK